MIRLLSVLLLALVGGSALGASSSEYRLANGLRVALRPIPSAKNAALVVLYSIGSDHDPEGRSGLAHLVEHVYVTAAAGSTPARTAEELMARTQGNAQTGEEQTVVGELLSPEELEVRLVDAAARMRDLRVQASDLEREKPRLVGEVSNMFGGIPALAAWNLAYERVRPSPSGARRGGTPAQVTALTLEQVKERCRRYYKPRNAVLVLAGNFDAARARKLIEKEFGGIPPGETVSALRPHPAPQAGIQAVSVKPLEPGEGPVFSMMYAVPSYSSPDFPPFLVLMSRLLQQIPQFGGSEAMDSFPPPVYYAPVDAPRVVALSGRLRPGETGEKAAGRFQRLLEAALRPRLRPEEIDAARMNPGMLLGIGRVPDAFWAQNPYGLALLTAYRIRTGLNPAQIDAAISRVKDADLRRCAASVFNPKRRAVVVVRPQ